MNPAILELIAQQLPAIRAGIVALFKHQNPDAPAPTEAEVDAAFHATLTESLAKDAAWLAAHQDTPAAESPAP